MKTEVLTVYLTLVCTSVFRRARVWLRFWKKV